jgi:hypothetical protein
VTERRTPLVKPRTREELATLVPQTLLLKHRQFVIGMLHATEVPNTDHSLLIGGYVIAENHQDSQHGQLLLSEALSRFREKGHKLAVAVTASDRAKRLFARSGGGRGSSGPGNVGCSTPPWLAITRTSGMTCNCFNSTFKANHRDGRTGGSLSLDHQPSPNRRSTKH